MATSVVRPHERGNLNRLSRPDDQTTWAFPWPSHPSAVYLCSLRRPSFISLFRPLTTVELAHLTTRRYSISHHMMTGIRPNKDTNEATEDRAHTALDDPNISHGDKVGSTSCQRRCGNDLHRALRNPESLRREALERAEAETERHYSMIVSAPTAAAQKGETASKTAAPDQIVVQGVTYTRRTGGPLHNMLVAKLNKGTRTFDIYPIPGIKGPFCVLLLVTGVAHRWCSYRGLHCRNALSDGAVGELYCMLTRLVDHESRQLIRVQWSGIKFSKVCDARRFSSLLRACVQLVFWLCPE
ncbi:hypothetical protein VFPBJ_09721 [Purpureocillium lilacinum]|uniref:Uncharacterized protein n=1 Tax=Purpureocillium lilacinum TaxID=33203 RepID=A0A179G9D4_PURLI|nr:hypothetical protein VFPBJ_09721 [Purpureocillium lilacinum]